MDIQFDWKKGAILTGTHLVAAAAGAAAWHWYATRVAVPELETKSNAMTFWDAAHEFVTWNNEATSVRVYRDDEMIAEVREEVVSPDQPNLFDQPVEVEHVAPPTRAEEEKIMQFIDDNLNTGEVVLVPGAEVVVEPEVVHLFGSPDDSGADGLWDWESELATRDEDDVYILHETEYFAKECPDFDQDTLFWYDEDKILTDSRDVIIYDVSGVVGELAFGHGCKDDDKCYVRNDRMRAEYEVIRIHASYENEVLNHVAEAAADDEDLRHSMRMYKFRME